MQGAAKSSRKGEYSRPSPPCEIRARTPKNIIPYYVCHTLMVWMGRGWLRKGETERRNIGGKRQKSIRAMRLPRAYFVNTHYAFKLPDRTENCFQIITTRPNAWTIKSAGRREISTIYSIYTRMDDWRRRGKVRDVFTIANRNITFLIYFIFVLHLLTVFRVE